MADQHEVDLDSIIDRLLEVRGSRPGKQVQLLEAEIRYLCTKAREIFISQPILLELEAPIKVGLLYSTSQFVTEHWCTIMCTVLERWLIIRTGRFAAIFTDNTMICSDCSNTAVSHPKPTISSLVTTSTVASSL